MRVGYLGPGRSTFGFEAAERFFKGEGDVEFVSFSSHTDVCRAAGRGDVDFGVMGVENVIEGMVTESIYAIDKLSRAHGLKISGEVEVPIKLFLFRKQNDGSAPTKIYAQPVAQGQCSQKLAAFKKANNDIPIESVASNSKAAEMASKDPSCVAISTAKAEQEYELVRLDPESITNNTNNFTRFWIVGTKRAKSTENDKTCLLINLDHPKPGGLVKALAPFAERGINLLLCTPIPIPGRKWEYTFLVEFAGSYSEQRMEDAYDQLCASGISMDAPLVLGSYPAGTTK
ncbi:MAG: prephenate dehydratase domain-containing protein [Candidatus Pacebacteria bacterium]|nr:prephenate dehydratase domain-containing protein [Candidatus Paceibacterota bacterium]MDD5357143.1 prephenate dehydratase domain-containing protein [Candidatus Paceibacterota bacterium]